MVNIRKLYFFINTNILVLLLTMMGINGFAQDSLEIFINVDNWTRNKIKITDLVQQRSYETTTFPNAYRRLTRCCCAGFQQKRILLIKDAGKYLTGDTVRLKIETKSNLTPFKHRYLLEFVIEEEKYLLVYIDRLIPFRTRFGYNMIIRKRLGCF